MDEHPSSSLPQPYSSLEEMDVVGTSTSKIIINQDGIDIDDINSQISDIEYENRLLLAKEYNRKKTFEYHSSFEQCIKLKSIFHRITEKGYSYLNNLVAMGFYLNKEEMIVKCFHCNFNYENLYNYPDDDKYYYYCNENENDIKCHCCNKNYLDCDKCHNCEFIQLSYLNKEIEKYKDIMEYNSLAYLHYEKNREQTFHEWPMFHIVKPKDLAKNGFYYLKKKDFASCIFCKGIVGKWEKGDTVMGEHKRHFGHCPFVKNEPCSNIPYNCCLILEKLPVEGEACPLPNLYDSSSTKKSNNIDNILDILNNKMDDDDDDDDDKKYLDIFLKKIPDELIYSAKNLFNSYDKNDDISNLVPDFVDAGFKYLGKYKSLWF